MKFEYLEDYDIEREITDALVKELDWLSQNQVGYGVSAIVSMLDFEYDITLSDLADFIRTKNNVNL